MPDAVLLIGRGPYEDPWHDYVATGGCVARTLTDIGLDVHWRSTFPDALEGIAKAHLLVVLAGKNQGPSDSAHMEGDWSRLHQRASALIDNGCSLLALHSASNTFSNFPAWPGLIGGRWVEGKSTHPPIGEAVFESVGAHPIVADIRSVRVFDEQYLHLDVAATSEPFLVARRAATTHPVAWAAATRPGHGRVVYDGLGHDTRSYESEDRRALLISEVRWLLDAAR